MADPIVSVGQMARYWWVLALRGLFAILFGVLAILWPDMALLTLVFMWGFYAMTIGITEIIVGVSGRWWSMALLGVLGVLAGIIAFLMPGLTALTLLYLIAAFFIVRGVFEIVAAIQLRKVIDNESWLALAGIASIIFGVLLFLFPGAGALSLVLFIGCFAIVLGVFSVALAFRIRSPAAIRPLTAAR